MRVNHEHGNGLVTCVALPAAAFGLSSGCGLPQRLTVANVEAVADEVTAGLGTTFLHRDA